MRAIFTFLLILTIPAISIAFDGSCVKDFNNQICYQTRTDNQDIFDFQKNECIQKGKEYSWSESLCPDKQQARCYTYEDDSTIVSTVYYNLDDYSLRTEKEYCLLYGQRWWQKND